MTRRTALALVVTAALAASCSSATSPEDPPQQQMPAESTPAPDATAGVEPELHEFYTQTLTWDNCGEQYQCSTMTVPLDYADPEGEQIEVSLLRVPATGDNPLGSLLVNPGGPGASGMEFARNAHVVASDAVRARFDIVGFDPRGVGESTPVDCVDDATLDEFVSIEATPGDEDELADLQEMLQTFTEACEARSGDLLPHVGTADVARDLDVMRAALGDQRLHYLGKSYGTFIGAFYADLFPDRVGRMVLDGALDPTLSGDKLAQGQAEGFQRALGAFLNWCLDNDCPIGDTEQEARQSLDQLLEEAETDPLDTGDQQRPLTPGLAFFGIILPLYLSADEGYPVLAAALDLAVNNGDGKDLLQLADLYLMRNPDGTYQGNQNEAIIAVNCLDRPDTLSIDQARANAATFEKISPIFGQFMAWGGLTCQHWPVEAEEDPAEINGAGAAPILVVGTTGDPATPYEWAEALADQLESGALLTYDAFVHTAYLKGSDCIDSAVDAYLMNGTMPESDLVCS